MAVICSLCGVRLGGLLEELTVAKARAGIEKPLHLMPQTARVVSGGEEKIIPAEEVRAGDILCVLPGESIPVDGVIISGQTSINQAVMTGESLPERETFQMVPGQGVCALVGGHTVLAGNPALLEGHGVSLLPMQAAEQAISTGSTVTYAAVDGGAVLRWLAFCWSLEGKKQRTRRFREILRRADFISLRKRPYWPLRHRARAWCRSHRALRVEFQRGEEGLRAAG